MTIRYHFLVGISFCTLYLSGCSQSDKVTPGISPLLPTITPTLPTATPEPLAALVDGDPIRLVDFEQEASRFEAAQALSGIDLATLGDYQGQILWALIDRRLLAINAIQSGAEIDQATLDQRITSLAAELGGAEAMGVWLAETGYTLDGFKSALTEEMLASQMVERILTKTPESLEQAHARHILVSSRDIAEGLLDQIASGANFADLARQYSLDPSTRPVGGNLSWFPRGYLLIPEVEEAAFALLPGEVSEVIESSLGFHLVQTIERTEKLLTPDALQQLREKAVKDWLTAQRETAEIQIFIEP